MKKEEFTIQLRVSRRPRVKNERDETRVFRVVGQDRLEAFLRSIDEDAFWGVTVTTQGQEVKVS